MIKVLLNPKDIHRGSLILVNKIYPIVNMTDDNIRLVPVNSSDSDIYLEVHTANMLNQLIMDLNCSNDVVPVSGYRSLEEQTQIYSESMVANGETFTEMYVALPNRSEHQTGMAIDLAKKQELIDFIRPLFPYKGVWQMFRDKGRRYGFIERYPKGKEHITGIAHEPWHFRYVGYPHAEIMHEKGFTLEEYIEFVRKFGYKKKHFKREYENGCIEIFFIKATPSMQSSIDIPEGAHYQISGNNVDGFIVTLWRANQ